MNALLIDVTKCTGCEQCVDACRRANDLEPELPFTRMSSDGLSSRRLTSLVPLSRTRFAKKQCLHCLKPGCVDACLVGAITKTECGAVVYDPGKCIGCRYCMLACPMGIPRYEWDKLLPYMKKCSMCFERQEEGEIPACVAVCPHGALSFGERDVILSGAKQIVAAQPDVYLQHVYGEHEFGGTCVMYITDVSLEKLGWSDTVGNRSIHSYTWPVMAKTPFLAAGVLGLGSLFIIRRRMKLEGQEMKKRLKESTDVE